MKSMKMKPAGGRRGKNVLLRGCCLSSLSAMALFGTVAQAGERHWDPNGAAVGTGGAGQWDVTAPTWSDNSDGSGGFHGIWDNGAQDTAVFGGAGGLVTLGAPITVGGVTFKTTSYALTGDALSLGGAAATITTDPSVTATIDSTILGGARLIKDGVGKLILTRDALHSGGTTIAMGTLQIGDSGTRGSVIGDILNNGILSFNRSDDVTYAGAVTGTGAVHKDGAGTLTLAGDSSFAGALRVNAGRLVLQNNQVLVGDFVIGAGDAVVEGPNARLVSSSVISTINAASSATDGALTVRSGGSASFLGLDIGNSTTGTATGILNVVGAGSRVTNTGNAVLARLGRAAVNILDGGRMTSSGNNVLVGSNLRATSTGVLSVSGVGSEWTITNALNMRRGTVTVSDGGAILTGSTVIGYHSGGIGSTADLLVTGAGSRLETLNNLVIANVATGGTRGAVTIADGGLIRVGGVLTMGAGQAALNIGGAEGQAATGAGRLEAPSVVTSATGRINFNHTDANYLFDAVISGAGRVNHVGGGTTILTGANSYAGETRVDAGALLINGDQSGALGLTSVASGATLGGGGVIGGDVTVADGGRLTPGGAVPGALTINGDLSLAAGSSLDFEFGGAGADDLIVVGGDLVLNGTINVAVSSGGALGPGFYRVFDYAGALTDNGLTLGATPPGSNLQVQTSIEKQVNLINTAGYVFRYWDAAAGGKNDGRLDGGVGAWLNLPTGDNWTQDPDAALNAAYSNRTFAVFAAASGLVTIDNSQGAVEAAGMQFASDGYVITGDGLILADAAPIIRVGDGTAAGAGMTATIASQIAGVDGLIKTDLGTLILTADNTYAGGTTIRDGVLQLGTGGAGGSIQGDVVNDGVLAVNRSDDFTFGGAISGAGALHQMGSGTTILTGNNSYTGGTTISAGTLQVGDGAFVGDVVSNGRLIFNHSSSRVFAGLVSGAGDFGKAGSGTVILTGDNSYAGATRVDAGTLLIHGDQSAATGLTSVAAGATLGGFGVIGGDVVIADGGTLAPGQEVGTLTINGDLSLADGSTLDMQLGQANVAGGALNDLITVGGDLTLDGMLNVSISPSGDFGAGIYRLINYSGTLTDNGLTLGAMPSGADAFVQTAMAGQVNLVNQTGLTLNFWDGAAGPGFNGQINGGDGVWQNSTGNANWTDASGAINAGFTDDAYAVFTGAAGVVTVDDGLGAVGVGGMQFAVDGYRVEGDAVTLGATQSVVRVGDGTALGADMTATIASQLTGAGELVKTDVGTLLLTADNTFTGGVSLYGGVVQVSRDANLGAASGALTFNDGALRTTADMTSARELRFDGAGSLSVDTDATLTLTGGLSGVGAFSKAGGGVLVLSGDSAGYLGAARVSSGVMRVDGVVGGSLEVMSGARLEGVGRVGATTNRAGGVIAPGHDGIGALTIAGDYIGDGGLLEIDAVLGGDASSADRLVVTGATSGTTQVSVTNRGGVGEQTLNGIKIIDVAGASNGVFQLQGDYLFEGEQAVAIGAYAYRLYQNGVTTPGDGDWYLRSARLDGQTALYQPGAPIYESYVQTLQALNGVSTLRQRVGERSWSQEAGRGVWGRVEGAWRRSDAVVSSTGAELDVDSWKMQVGVDAPLLEREGAALIGGVAIHYGEARGSVAAEAGAGGIDATSYGLTGTLTWYGAQGLYADVQAQVNWFEGDLASDVLGHLVDGNDGSGRAVSLEVGKRWDVKGLTLTPQIQIAYDDVRFDRFIDPVMAEVARGEGDSLKTRWGVAVDHHAQWGGQDQRRSHVYGVANLTYEWLDGAEARVSGTSLRRREDRLQAELGVGGSYAWTDRVTFYGEASGATSVKDPGEGYQLKAQAGIRLQF